MIEINLIGKKFGDLVVFEKVSTKGALGVWNCICNCGNEVITTGNKLKRKYIQDCGCKKQKGIYMNKIILKFLNEQCYINYSQRGICGSDLYKEYEKWCLKNNFYIDTKTMFGRVAGKVYEKKHISSGVIYEALCVKE